VSTFKTFALPSSSARGGPVDVATRAQRRFAHNASRDGRVPALPRAGFGALVKHQQIDRRVQDQVQPGNEVLGDPPTLAGVADHVADSTEDQAIELDAIPIEHPASSRQ